jgi:hypothetical protein
LPHVATRPNVAGYTAHVSLAQAAPWSSSRFAGRLLES